MTTRQQLAKRYHIKENKFLNGDNIVAKIHLHLMRARRPKSITLRCMG